MADYLVSLVVVPKDNDSIAQNPFCGRGALGELFERQIPVGLDLRRLLVSPGGFKMESVALIVAPTPSDAEKPGGIKCYGALQEIVNRA